MAKFTWDHVHLRTTNPEATAQWYERMLGAEVIRTMQQGKPRIDLKLGGANIFIAPVDGRRRRQPAADHALPGPRPFRADGHRHRRHRRRAQGQGRRVHQGADHGAAGRARRLHPRARRGFDRAARPQPREVATTRLAEAIKHGTDKQISGHPYRCGVAAGCSRPSNTTCLRGHATEAPGSCALNYEKRARHLRLRGLRSAAVRVETQVRERHRLAELQRSGPGLGRGHRGPQLRHGPHRGALQPLRQPSRPCVRRRPAADRICATASTASR